MSEPSAGLNKQLAATGSSSEPAHVAAVAILVVATPVSKYFLSVIALVDTTRGTNLIPDVAPVNVGILLGRITG